MRRMAGVVLGGVLLAACSHSPPASREVPKTAPGASSSSSVPATPPAGNAPSASPATPSSPATLPPRPPGILSPQAAHRPVQPGRQLADGSQVPAVQSLLATADRALAKGELDTAAVSLERAQRLAPQSAVVYQRLADIRLRQERPAEAEQLARKALGYTNHPAQQAAIWRQIAAARQQQGKGAAAQDALERASLLEGRPLAPEPQP